MSDAILNRRPQTLAIKLEVIKWLNARGIGQGWKHIHDRHDLIKNLSWCEFFRPAHEGHNANSPFKRLTFTPTKRCIVCPTHRVRSSPVITKEENNCVVRQPL